MNNCNIYNDNLLCKFFQLTSLDKLDTMNIDSILNKIKNANNTHIYMFKGYIPPQLFEKIENYTLSMFDDIDLAVFNLERTKKLLPIELYEKHVKACLNAIIEKDLIGGNIANIRDNVPLHLYTTFLEEYVEDENCWKYFLNSVFNIQEKDILKLLDSSSPTMEKYLLVSNVPKSVYNILSHEKYVIVLQMWKIIDEPDFAYCEKCIDNKKSIGVFSSNVGKLKYNDLQNSQYWCCKCMYTPLLKIIDYENTYIDTEYIDNLQNS